MLVPDSKGVECLLVVLFEDFLEDVLESSVVFLQNGVLGAHVQWHFLGDGVLQA